MKKTAFILALAAFAAFFPAPAQAEDLNVLRAEMQKLSQKQDQVLKALEEIKAELQIVKIRATNG